MSYTDGKKAPRPTESERAFAALTDEEREAISKRWLRGVGAQLANELYDSCEEDNDNE